MVGRGVGCRYLFKYIIIGDTGAVLVDDVLHSAVAANRHIYGYLGKVVKSCDGWTASFGTASADPSSWRT